MCSKYSQRLQSLYTITLGLYSYQDDKYLVLKFFKEYCHLPLPNKREFFLWGLNCLSQGPRLYICPNTVPLLSSEMSPPHNMYDMPVVSDNGFFSVLRMFNLLFSISIDLFSFFVFCHISPFFLSPFTFPYPMMWNNKKNSHIYVYIEEFTTPRGKNGNMYNSSWSRVWLTFSMMLGWTTDRPYCTRE